MTQLSARMMIGKDGQLDQAKAQQYFEEYGVGSVLSAARQGCLNSSLSATSVEGWRHFVQQYQAFVMATNLSVPLLWGLDSTHGSAYIDKATIFPHSFGAVAAFRPEYIERQAKITMLDSRVAGVPWIFSPILGLGMNPLWSRFYETPGEDPFIGQQFGGAYMRGIVAAAEATGGVASSATMKHYMGYSNPRTGHDRTDAWIPDAYLKQYFQPSFGAAVANGASSVMINSGSVNGVPTTQSKAILTSILRTELGCDDCLAVTDWQDIEKLHGYHYTAATEGEAIVQALDAGVDSKMVMLSRFACRPSR